MLAVDTYQRQKEKVLQLFQPVAAFARARANDPMAARLEEAARHLEAGKLAVVVAGEFKQGKSSLVNALLDEPDLFPVDIDITTSLVSTITYGEQEKVSVVLGEPGREKQQTIRRDEIADYVTEQRNPRNARQARLLVIESPNPRLKDGLTLVDTPGVGGLNVRHTDVAYAFLPNADAVLFVSDALKPLTAVELDFIARRIARHCREVLYVVTKIDAAPDYRTVVANNRTRLAEVLGRPAGEVPLIPVSSKLKLDYLRSRDAEDLADSNFKQLEDELWQLLNERRGKILLLRALSELSEALAELKRPLEAEAEVLQQRTRQEQEELERRSQGAAEGVKRLTAPDAPWRTELRDGVADIKTRVPALFEEGIHQVRRQVELYMDDPRLLESPQQIAGLVEVDLDALMSETGAELGRQAAALHAGLQAALGLDLNPFEVGRLVLEKGDLAATWERAKTASSWDKVLHTVRSSTFLMSWGSTIGGTLGGTVGFLLGGFAAGPGMAIGAAVGGFLGSVAGLASNTRKSLEQLQDKTRGEVARIVGRYIDDSQRRGGRALQDALTRLERSVRDELDDKIRREREACEGMVQSIKAARKLSEEQAARRSAELKALLQQLALPQRGAEEMIKGLVDSGPAGGPRRPRCGRHAAGTGGHDVARVEGMADKVPGRRATGAGDPIDG